MTQGEKSSGRPVTGRHVLYAFLAFFGVIFVADSYMIYKAVTTFGGLETTDAYRKGLAYNDRIAIADAQAKRGWSDKVGYSVQSGQLQISLLDRDGDGVSGLAVAAKVGRPATNRYDHTIAFSQSGPGIYEAHATGLEPGWWTIDIVAARGSEVEPVYQARRRLWIKP